jgi:hypothetical protein
MATSRRLADAIHPTGVGQDSSQSKLGVPVAVIVVAH